MMMVVARLMVWLIPISIAVGRIIGMMRMMIGVGRHVGCRGLREQQMGMSVRDGTGVLDLLDRLRRRCSRKGERQHHTKHDTGAMQRNWAKTGHAAFLMGQG